MRYRHLVTEAERRVSHDRKVEAILEALDGQPSEATDLPADGEYSINQRVGPHRKRVADERGEHDRDDAAVRRQRQVGQMIGGEP